MSRRHLALAALPLLLAAQVQAAGNPLASIPAIASPDAQGQVDCQPQQLALEQVYQQVGAREQAINDERDVIEPQAQAEQQAQMLAAMQGGMMTDPSALIANAQGLQTAGSTVLETDAECIAYDPAGGRSANFNVTKGLAPAVRTAQKALHEKLKAAPEAQYQDAFKQAAPQYLGQINAALDTAKSRNDRCASDFQTRTQKGVAGLKGATQKLMLLEADADLYRLKRAEGVARDAVTLCEDLGYRLSGYARGPGAARGYTSMSAAAQGQLGETGQKLKDGANSVLDKAKALGSLFGR